jgi:hypothetical protein
MIRKGTILKWNWGKGSATGKVEEVFKQDVSRIIKGNKVYREASKESPTYMIVQEDSAEVLKSKSEVKRAE